MERVEKIENEIEDLEPEEVAELRRWFAEFDNALWDAQIKADAKSDRLDELGREALDAYEAGEVSEL